MSIDDMFLRDPRVKLLATACGWNKYEARGRLLDVFAIVYDRVDSGGSDVLSFAEVDGAAEHEGFGERMIAADLGVRVHAGLRIRGAKDRTKYLATREESGRRGGVKSGESRRNRAKVVAKVTFPIAKVTFPKNEGRLNLPDPVPDPASVPDPVPDLVTVPDRAPASDPDPDARARRVRGELAESLWSRLSAERLRVARELGVANALPFPKLSPAHHPTSFRNLLERLREEGDHARAVADRVLANLVGQAEEHRTIDWLSEKAFSPGGWRVAREDSRPGVKTEKTPEPTAIERAAARRVLEKLGTHADVEYENSEKHVRFVVKRLREGHDEMDLRKIVGYLALPHDEGGMGWCDDDKMRGHLIPETVLKRESVDKYLAPARAWYARHSVQGDAERRPARASSEASPLANAFARIGTDG